MNAPTQANLPKRKQRAITIRSDKAFKRLELLTRDGRSQVEIIEDALERMPLPVSRPDLDTFRRKIDRILADVDPDTVPSMAEFDAATYDENGLPR